LRPACSAGQEGVEEKGGVQVGEKVRGWERLGGGEVERMKVERGEGRKNWGGKGEEQDRRGRGKRRDGLKVP